MATVRGNGGIYGRIPAENASAEVLRLMLMGGLGTGSGRWQRFGAASLAEGRRTRPEAEPSCRACSLPKSSRAYSSLSSPPTASASRSAAASSPTTTVARKSSNPNQARRGSRSGSRSPAARRCGHARPNSPFCECSTQAREGHRHTLTRSKVVERSSPSAGQKSAHTVNSARPRQHPASFCG
jgi:hypothetical protein